MLKRVYGNNVNKLMEKLIDIQDDPCFKYYGDSHINYSYMMNQKGDWDVLRKISINENEELIGCFTAKIDREKNYITSFGAVNFTKKLNMIFSRDFKQFFEELFIKYNYEKISWVVLIGNPAEKIYDKAIDKYGGRIVGIHKKDAFNTERELCDVKCYEIFRHEYISKRRKEGN